MQTTSYNLAQCMFTTMLLSMLLPHVAQADIYIARDDQEEIYLTNLADTDEVGVALVHKANAGKQAIAQTTGSTRRFRVLVADEPPAAFNAKQPSRQQHQSLPFAAAVQAAANGTSLEPALLHAVMAVESNNNPKAVSAKGARGLMQLMPATSKQYEVSNPYDPAQNIAAGARYLQALQRMFNGDTRLALAAYNAGPSAVIKSGFTIPPFSETQRYVPKVMHLYQQLKEAETP